MNNISGIYVILNKKNGKVYIGQAVDFRRRWINHKAALRNNYHGNRHLQAAWNKYGEKPFKFQKLEYCAIEQLDEREQHYLDIYMSKGLCYNIAKDVKSPVQRLIRNGNPRKATRGDISPFLILCADVVAAQEEVIRLQTANDMQRGRIELLEKMLLEAEAEIVALRHERDNLIKNSHSAQMATQNKQAVAA